MLQPISQPMSREERDRLYDLAHEAGQRGDKEERHKLLRKIPLAPHLAKFFKEKYGADFLLSGGFNLAEAEAEYGQNWLTQ